MRAIGAIPILVTPLSRRNYRDGALIQDDGLGDSAAAMHQVADEDDVTVVDLLSMFRHLLSTMDQQQADQFDAQAHSTQTQKRPRKARSDSSERAWKAVFGRLVADHVIRMQVELGPNVIGFLNNTPTALRSNPVRPTDTEFHLCSACASAAASAMRHD